MYVCICLHACMYVCTHEGPSTRVGLKKQLSLSCTDPGHVIIYTIKELILKQKVVIIYFHAISTKY
jgi:hypothetical protein